MHTQGIVNHIVKLVLQICAIHKTSLIYDE